MNWPRLVRRRARATGADLPPGAVDELAAHLEDVYLAARRDGSSEAEARARAIEALQESPLATLVDRPHRRFQDPPLPVTPAGPSPFRSLSMSHALRLAARQFLHHRGFAFVTVLVLGLGIGSSVAVYSVVQTVLLRPLPYHAPDRLVALWETNHDKGLMREPISPVNFMDYRGQSVFADAAAWWRPDVNLADPGLDPVRVRTIETAGNLFQVLGVVPQLGPGFPKDGPLHSTELIAVISDRLWRSRYGADPHIIGKALTLNGARSTVVGVMPPRFDYPGDIDVWQRLRWDMAGHSRDAHFMEAVARLAPEASIAVAQTQLDALTRRLAEEAPASNNAVGVRATPLLDDLLGYYRPALLVLTGAVVLLLGIACLNVASLLLTRAMARDREIAVRTALGATPRHLLMQLFAEGAVLSIAGAAVGIAVAAGLLPLLVRMAPDGIPRLDEVAVDRGVLAAAIALTLATTVIFGLVPASLVRRRAITAGLRAVERGASRASTGLYRALVVAEVALACALLMASALLVRTVGRMTEVPTGVTRVEALTAGLQLSSAAIPEWTRVADIYGALVDDLASRPGVRAVGGANFLPFDAGWRVPFAIEGVPLATPHDGPTAQYHSVTDGFFEAMGAQLVAGRFFARLDTRDRPGVVVVNETLANRHLGGAAAIGRFVTTTTRGIGPLGRNVMPAGARYEVVGVVADVRNMGFGQPVEPAVYFSARQFPFRAMTLVIDAVDAPSAMAALTAALRQQAPGVPAADARTWGDRLRARTAEPRLLMTLLVCFGTLAAVLAALGVYGLFSWSVALRTRELAIRLTLGARPIGVGAAVLRQAAIISVVGLAGGVACIRLAEPALGRVLFDVPAHDLSSLAAAGAILLAASLAACLPAAWRAMRVDPVEGLRTE